MANPRTSIARTADSKAVTSASSLALASNPDRLEVTIVNDADTADVYLGFVTPSNPTGAAIAGKGIALNLNGGNWTSSSYTGAITVVTAGAGVSSVTVLEF